MLTEDERRAVMMLHDDGVDHESIANSVWVARVVRSRLPNPYDEYKYIIDLAMAYVDVSAAVRRLLSHQTIS